MQVHLILWFICMWIFPKTKIRDAKNGTQEQALIQELWEDHNVYLK